MPFTSAINQFVVKVRAIWSKSGLADQYSVPEWLGLDPPSPRPPCGRWWLPTVIEDFGIQISHPFRCAVNENFTYIVFCCQPRLSYLTLSHCALNFLAINKAMCEMQIFLLTSSKTQNSVNYIDILLWYCSLGFWYLTPVTTNTTAEHRHARTFPYCKSPLSAVLQVVKRTAQEKRNAQRK